MGLVREGAYNTEALNDCLGVVPEGEEEGEAAAVVVVPYVFSLEWEEPIAGSDWREAIDIYNERLEEIEAEIERV